MGRGAAASTKIQWHAHLWSILWCYYYNIACSATVVATEVLIHCVAILCYIITLRVCHFSSAYVGVPKVLTGVIVQ